MLSRSLMPGRQSRSFPSSCRRTRAGSSARNRIRPSSRTWSGSFSTRRDWSAASMLERSPPPYGPSKRISRDRPLPPTAMRFQLEDRCTGFAALQTARGTTMGIRRYSVATAAVCAACGAAPRAGRAPAPPIPAVSTKALEWQWDDYKDTDLRGKVLLLLVNDPGLQDSTVFNGKALTHYGRWTYKLEEAARRGALGAILVHTTESATYPWEVVRGSWSVEQFKLDRAMTQGIAFAGWVTHVAAQSALAETGLDLDSLTRAAARRDFRPVPTGLHATVDIGSDVRHIRSENVVAKLTGSDPALAGQAVLITAHWDHKGIGPAVNGDSIYNGAV